MADQLSLNASQAPSTATSSSLRQERRNSSNQVNYSAGDTLHEPILPWMGTRTSVQSVISSDVHTMKRYLPDGAPILPVKTWNRWTWHKIWLMLMNSLVHMFLRMSFSVYLTHIVLFSDVLLWVNWTHLVYFFII
jgi:hypothetical protein